MARMSTSDMRAEIRRLPGYRFASLGLRLLLDQPDQNECLPPGLIWSARRRRPDDNFKAKQK
jgi:hypothetical protein